MGSGLVFSCIGIHVNVDKVEPVSLSGAASLAVPASLTPWCRASRVMRHNASKLGSKRDRDEAGCDVDRRRVCAITGATAVDNKFSIVMPAYNSARYIQRAIESVINQTEDAWELLIIDDASQDATVDIIKRYEESDSRIRVFVRTNNGGAGIARNMGIEASCGRYIAFLDSDDIWYAEKLEKQAEVFGSTGASLVYGAYGVAKDPCDRVERYVWAPRVVKYADLLAGCPVGCLTAAYDAQKVGKKFMPELRQRQDWGLWMRVLRSFDYGIGIQEPVACLRVRSDSLTASKMRATRYTWRLLRDEAGLGKARAAYGVCRHLSSAAWRRVRATESGRF